MTQLILVQVCHGVGVFLDLNKGVVCFYNMTDSFHIFSFPLASSTGSLFLYIMSRSGDVSLAIFSVVGGPGEDPVLSPSLEETVNLPGQGFSPGSGVDNASQGAKSSLLFCSPMLYPP